MKHAVLAILCCLLFGAGPALASGGAAEGGPHWNLLGFQILNTVVLLLILLRFTRRPIRDFLIQRSNSIRRGIEEAEGRVRDAEAEIEQLRRRLSHFSEEAGQIIARSAEQADAERARGIERAQGTAQRIREEAQRVADQEIVRARQELQAEAAELAASLARDLVREQLTLEDDRRFVREYVERAGRLG